MKKIISSLVIGTLAAAPLQAQERASVETRMREALRNTTLQVRNLQAERDDLSLKHQQAEQQIKTLEEQVKSLIKRATEEKEHLDSVKSKLLEQETATRRATQELEEWKTTSHKMSELAKTKENQRAALAEKVILHERVIADQKRKNAEMHKIAKEILQRYANFGLGTALTAREPFVGITRVKLENLVQDYSDQLSEQRIKP